MGLTKADMERMALELRGKLGVAEDEALDPFQIHVTDVTYLTTGDIDGLSPQEKSYLDGEGAAYWSAMSVPLDSNQEKWAILINESHDIERQRVSLLEELWHIIQGHKLVSIIKIGPGYGRSFDSEDEHDAYYLAGATLFPASEVKRMIKAKISALEMAKHHGISTELIEYRIKRLGYWSEYKGKEIRLTQQPRA